MPRRLRVRQRPIHQRTANTSLPKRGSTVSGPNNSAGVSPTQIGSCRTEPTIKVPIRRRKGQIEQMIDMFTQTIGAERVTPGPERALMKALDGLFVVGGFSQNGQRDRT